MRQKSNIEWSIIRGSIVIFFLSAAIAAGLISFTYYFRDDQLVDFQKNKSQFQAISQRYLAVDQEEKNIREYYPDYSGLYADGVIGREHRLNWIEVLRNAGKEIKLPSVDYEISSQTEYDNAFPLTKGNYKVFVSSMSLNLKLLHEGDLLRLVEKLNQKAIGLFSIRECEMNRKNTVIKRSANTTNIDAKCIIDWYSIKKFDGTELSI